MRIGTNTLVDQIATKLGATIDFRSWTYVWILAHLGYPQRPIRMHEFRVYASRFRSVVVITSALHAEGRRFEPGRNQFNIFTMLFLKDLWRRIRPVIYPPLFFNNILWEVTKIQNWNK